MTTESDVTPDDRPTQVAHPGRSTARSTTATLVGLGPLMPILVQQLGETKAAVVIAVALAGNAVVTRVLAYPQVEDFLRRTFPPLAADTSRRTET